MKSNTFLIVIKYLTMPSKNKYESTYNNLLKKRITYLFSYNDLLFIWANYKSLSKEQYAENLNFTKDHLITGYQTNNMTYSFYSFPKRALNRFFINAVLPLKGCGVFILGLNKNNKTNIIKTPKISQSLIKVKYSKKCALLLSLLLKNYKLQNIHSLYYRYNLNTKKSLKTKDLLNILRVYVPQDLNQLLGAFVKQGNTYIWIPNDEIKQSLHLIHNTLKQRTATLTTEALAKTSFCNIIYNIKKVSTPFLQYNQKLLLIIIFFLKKLHISRLKNSLINNLS